jgi:L-alanine-DL-glutamate epimerase-like enolase superfamily enzyme
MSTPVVRDMRVVPIAGHDSMLLNLSGAHGPFFTRNLVILTDSDGNTGVGEVPGGEPIRRTLEMHARSSPVAASAITTPCSTTCAAHSVTGTREGAVRRRSTCASPCTP